MKTIEDIIYHTTRELRNVEDKLRIATVFLFCKQLGQDRLSELLYVDDHVKFISDLNEEFSNYEVDFTINLSDMNIRNAFYKTLEQVRQEWDEDGFLKAIWEGDEFALVILKIINTDFSKEKFINRKAKMAHRLGLWQEK